MAFGLVGAVALAGATIPGEDGTILGCYDKNSGNLRVVESHDDCRPSENSISWSQEGPVGPPGPAGDDGEGGLASIEDLQDLPCTFGSQTGTVDVTLESTSSPAVKSIDLTCNMEAPPDECGGVEIPVLPNADAACDPETGEISYQCVAGFDDVNGDLGQPDGDGCEFGPDMDGDGVAAPPNGIDCDDSNEHIPGPEVIGNNQDDDCDGQIDEGSAITGLSLSSDTVGVDAEVTLTVTLDGATASDVVVTLTCTPESVVGGCSTVTIPTGSASGQTMLTALEPGTVEIVATLGPSSASIQLLVE